MELLVVILFLYFCIWLAGRYAPRSGGADKAVYSTYSKRSVVMDKYEQALYYLLCKHLPKDYYIFPKMRIADFVKIEDGKGYYHNRNQILSRHVDFIICNDKFCPVMAVELNGSSHMKPDTISRDIMVSDVYRQIDLPFTTVRVGESFHDNCIKIREKLTLLQKGM